MTRYFSLYYIFISFRSSLGQWNCITVLSTRHFNQEILYYFDECVSYECSRRKGIVFRMIEWAKHIGWKLSKANMKEYELNEIDYNISCNIPPLQYIYSNDFNNFMVYLCCFLEALQHNEIAFSFNGKRLLQMNGFEFLRLM